ISCCDNDIGIKQNGDGTQYILANNQHTVRIAPGEMQVLEIIRAENTNRQPLISDNNSTF
ncbi:TPA: phage tail protein, partial [Salmonella enterica]